MNAPASKRTESWTTLVRSVNAVIRTARTSTMSDSQAHGARKALKKARASLRLLKRSLGKPAYRRENTVLRDASRVISPLRDARAQIDLLAAVGKRYREELPSRELAPIEAALRKDLRKTRRRVRNTAPSMRHMVAALKDCLDRLRRVGPRSLKASEIMHGLRGIYAGARDAFATASSSRTAATLHEWRKKTKYLYNAIDLLGKDASNVSAPMRKRAQKLGDYLGEEHDLVVLSGELRTKGASRARVRRRLGPLIAQRRRKLARKALRLGAKTYAESPKKAIRS